LEIGLRERTNEIPETVMLGTGISLEMTSSMDRAASAWRLEIVDLR
jgi:hypothetical protein